MSIHGRNDASLSANVPFRQPHTGISHPGPPRAHFTHDYTPIYTHIGEALVRLVDQPPVVEIMFANALGDGQLNAVRMMIVVECDRQRSFEVRIEIRVQIGQVDDG